MQSVRLTPQSQILITGGGPAGTSAAIRLKLKGFQVKLIEREKFPRHKLCGEFISPECFGHFAELGVLEKMLAVGGDRISETTFYSPGGKSVSVPSEWFSLQESALGLSRAEMDFQLLERAKEIGVEVLEEASVVGLLSENKKIVGVKTKNAEITADLIIDASGRARILGKLIEKQIQPPKIINQNRLVGFKAHLSQVEMEKGRCEIYFFRGGYGGLNYVENGIANHCFLIKSEIVKEFGGDVEKILTKVIFENVRAKEVLQNAEPLFAWLAVSVEGFGAKNLHPAPNVIAVGDAGAFIDPFTGSGMLMAMESAEILAQLVDFDVSIAEIGKNYQKLHALKFTRRLQICRIMRRAAFAPNISKYVISALSLAEKPREILARATRPKFSILKK